MLVKDTPMTRPAIVLAGFLLLGTIAQAEEEPVAFPYTGTEKTRERQLSAAMHRSFFHYPAPRPEDNELYSQFKYAELKGFDYHGGDGTISRRAQPR